MKLKLIIWRQESPSSNGGFKEYELDSVSPDSSFLEMLDLLNDKLVLRGEEPVAFEHDCREGICGSCAMTINGRPHGPKKLLTACQLHMRHFRDGDTIRIEPWRAKPFPVQKDLVVDRSSFDRIQQAGAYISVNTGAAPEANLIPVQKEKADQAFDAAACIGCGACVAACPNGSAMLFTAAKVSQFSLLPQGQPERTERVVNMVEQMDSEGFGGCTNLGECQDACPKGISIKFITQLNRDYISAQLKQLASSKGSVKSQ